MLCVFCLGVYLIIFPFTYQSNHLKNNKINISISASEEAQTTTYAKALVGCNLYKTQEMNQNYQDIYFIIPETYFVIILETISDNCFKVQYDKFIGYVDSSTVILATFVPIVKTLDNISFDIKTTSGTQIWQYPTTRSSICTTLTAGTKNINYIAFAYGQVPSGGESNIWYYVCYTPDSNSTNVYEGYIYSENTINLTEIVANTESNPEVIEDLKNNDKLIYISSTLKTIVITIIAIPIILFFAIILYKLIKNFKKNTKYSKIQELNTLANEEMNNDKMKYKQFDKFHDMKLVKENGSRSHYDDIDDELL